MYRINSQEGMPLKFKLVKIGQIQRGSHSTFLMQNFMYVLFPSEPQKNKLSHLHIGKPSIYLSDLEEQTQIF